MAFGGGRGIFNFCNFYVRGSNSLLFTSKRFLTTAEYHNGSGVKEKIRQVLNSDNPKKTKTHILNRILKAQGKHIDKKILDEVFATSSPDCYTLAICIQQLGLHGKIHLAKDLYQKCRLRFYPNSIVFTSLLNG